MMLETIDQGFKGEYDFFYLPIDFKVISSLMKNKCNMGYAFINFINSRTIGDFYRRFNRKKWESFNSEKICEITYGRIQGREELCKHFETSRIIQQTDKRNRPLILPKSNLSNIHILIEKQVNFHLIQKNKVNETKRNSN